jgi:hypothetical protein
MGTDTGSSLFVGARVKLDTLFKQKQGVVSCRCNVGKGAYCPECGKKVESGTRWKLRAEFQDYLSDRGVGDDPHTLLGNEEEEVTLGGLRLVLCQPDDSSWVVDNILQGEQREPAVWLLGLYAPHAERMMVSRHYDAEAYQRGHSLAEIEKLKTKVCKGLGKLKLVDNIDVKIYVIPYISY